MVKNKNLIIKVDVIARNHIYRDIEKGIEEYNRYHLPVRFTGSPQVSMTVTEAGKPETYIEARIIPEEKKMTSTDILSLVNSVKKETEIPDIELVVPDAQASIELKRTAQSHFGWKLEDVYTVAETGVRESGFRPIRPLIILIGVRPEELVGATGIANAFSETVLLEISNPANQKGGFNGLPEITYNGKNFILQKEKAFSSLCLVKNLLEDLDFYSRLDLERVLEDIESGNGAGAVRPVLARVENNLEVQELMETYLRYFQYLTPEERVLNRDLGELYVFFLALFKGLKRESASTLNLPVLLNSYEQEYDNYTGNIPKITESMRESELAQSARLFQDLPEASNLSRLIRETPEYQEYRRSGDLAMFKEQLPLLVMAAFAEKPGEFPTLIQGGILFQSFIDQFLKKEEET